MKHFIQAWRGFLKFMGDATASYQIVFYSEGKEYAPFLRPVIDALADTFDGLIYYLTSDAADPALLAPPPHVRSFFIGEGGIRTYTLNHLRADIMVMTMPDLNLFHIKRSPHVRHYAYIHHSMVSTHMIYRKGAFDHFDSILCVGPYHLEETREWETLHALPAKQLFEHGYAPLDTLILAARKTPPPPIGEDGRLNVLLAPSWGAEGLMETRAEETVGILLDAGHSVRVRPHPRTRLRSGPVLDALKAKFDDHPCFGMDEDTKQFESLFNSHLMISDWSGAAMEFSFGLERPVLFIDGPRKINNPDYAELTATPLEVSYREDAGAVLSPDELSEIPAALATLQADAGSFGERMRKLRARHVFHIGESAKRGAEILVNLAASFNCQN